MFEEIMKKQRIRGINIMAQQTQHRWGALWLLGVGVLQGNALLPPLFQVLGVFSKHREIRQNGASHL